MSYIVADRVKETTTVTGTGPATLAGASSGYRSFASQLSIGDTCAYVIVNSNASEWETGIGTYSAINTLTRTTIHASTNANAAVVFTAGVKDVFMGPTANTILSDVTSTDGSVTINQTGTISDLSVAVAPATLNVLVAVRNTTGATLVKGTVVYISGSTGQISTVTKAIANSDANSAQTLGMISADLDDNTNGYVTIIGLIDNVDTKGYSAGTQLYLSPTVAGEFTSTKPYAPNHLVYVGIVERGTVQGKIFVKVQNGYELDELHNVAAQSPSNGQTIVYNSTNQLWEKNTVSLTAGVNGTLSVANGGTGVTTSTGTGSAVLSNTPTLVTPQTNAINAVPVVSGAGNSLILTAGSGVTSGAGGSLILQAGAQATSGGDGKIIVKGLSGSTQNLQEWQDSTGSVLSYVTSAGNLSFSSSSAAIVLGPSVTLQRSGGALSITQGGQTTVFNANSITFSSSQRLTFGSSNSTFGSDATNELSQRNGVNAQTFRVYNTYTDASNYERLGITWASNICTIGLAQAGTGSVRSLVIAGANATSGAGGNVTITAGNGSGVGAGGNIILQPGAQGTSGGNGVVQISSSTTLRWGTNDWTVIPGGSSYLITQCAGDHRFVLSAYSGYKYVSIRGCLDFHENGDYFNGGSPYATVRAGLELASHGVLKLGQGQYASYGGGASFAITPSSQDVGTTFSITNKTLTSNVATLTTSVAHKFQYGQKITISGVDATFDGTYTITAPVSYSTTATTFSYAKTAADVASQAATGSCWLNLNDVSFLAGGFLRLNTTVASTITGISFPANAPNGDYTYAHVNGRMVRVYNVGTANLTLAHNSASSTAANRMFSLTGADIILAPNDYAELIYDATSNGSGAAGWRVS